MSQLLNGGDREGEGLEVGVEVEVEAEGPRQRNQTQTRTRNSDSVATSWPQASITFFSSVSLPFNGRDRHTEFCIV